MSGKRWSIALAEKPGPKGYWPTTCWRVQRRGIPAAIYVTLDQRLDRIVRRCVRRALLDWQAREAVGS